MSDSHSSAVAIIPARAGSKGLPGKNLRRLAGTSLVGRAIGIARQLSDVTRIVVSTDGQDIAAEAEQLGASIHWRPPELAGDRSPVIETVRHLRAGLREEGESARIGLLLEPTTPLRTVDEVERCLAAVQNGADSSATFTEACLHPHRAFALEDDQIAPFIAGADASMPRQSLQPAAFQLSGGAYAFDLDALPDEGVGFLFGRCVPVVVPRLRSLDVDDEIDFAVAEALLARDREGSMGTTSFDDDRGANG